MKILSLDVASKLGWALFDVDKTASGIVSGSIKLEGASSFDKAEDMRRKLPKLIREHRPDFAVMEAPLEFAPQFKKVKQTLLGEEEVSSSINPRTIAMLNRLAGAAQMAVQGQNVPLIEVRPQTWQSIIPRSITGKPKQRVQAFCDMLRIVSPNMDSRDACVIAYWAAGHCQELKLMSRAA